MAAAFKTHLRAGFLVCAVLGTAAHAQAPVKAPTNVFAAVKDLVGLPSLRVPDLSNPKDLASFRQQGQAACGSALKIVVAKPAAAANAKAPPQSPPVGSLARCNQTIVVPPPAGATPYVPSTNPLIFNPSQKPFLVGNLNNPLDVATLEQKSRALCGSPAVINAEVQPSPRPTGTFISQYPPPNTPYSCNSSIESTRSSGPPPVQPRQFPVGDLSLATAVQLLENRVGEVCKGTKLALHYASTPSQQPRGAYVTQTPLPAALYSCGEAVVIYLSQGPASFPVGDLNDPASVNALQQQSQALCGSPATITTLSRPSPLAAGAFVGQSPPADTIFTCSATLTKTVSAGPVPAANFDVGDLSNPTGIQTLRNNAGQACGGKTPSIGRVQRVSSRPRGAFDGQDPQPTDPYACGEKVVVYMSLGPPRFEVGDMSDPAAITALQTNVQRACNTSFSPKTKFVASDLPAGSYMGQDPESDATYVCGETVTILRVGPTTPSWIPVLALIAGVSILSVGGWAGWRWAHPKLGVREGSPAWSAMAQEPVKLLDPDIEVTVEGAPPEVAVRGGLVILG